MWTHCTTMLSTRHDDGRVRVPGEDVDEHGGGGQGAEERQTPPRRPEVHAHHGDDAEHERDGERDEVQALGRSGRAGAGTAHRPGSALPTPWRTARRPPRRRRREDRRSRRPARGRAAPAGWSRRRRRRSPGRCTAASGPPRRAPSSIVRCSSRSTVLTLPGAGAVPTPKANAPLATWPSTAETLRQLTVYTPLPSGEASATCSSRGLPGTGCTPDTPGTTWPLESRTRTRESLGSGFSLKARAIVCRRLRDTGARGRDGAGELGVRQRCSDRPGEARQGDHGDDRGRPPPSPKRR